MDLNEQKEDLFEDDDFGEFVDEKENNASKVTEV